MKILELYTDFNVGKSFFPEEKIEGRKATPLLKDVKDETYDHIISAHTLNYFSYVDIPTILIEWTRTLKPGGSIIIITPSLEWVAEQILSETPSIATLPILFGSQDKDMTKAHYCGFTMASLHKLFDNMGLHVTHARTGIFDYVYSGYKVEAEQHLIIGKKENNVARKRHKKK